MILYVNNRFQILAASFKVKLFPGKTFVRLNFILLPLFKVPITLIQFTRFSREGMLKSQEQAGK